MMNALQASEMQALKIRDALKRLVENVQGSYHCSCDFDDGHELTCPVGEAQEALGIRKRHGSERKTGMFHNDATCQTEVWLNDEKIGEISDGIAWYEIAAFWKTLFERYILK